MPHDQQYLLIGPPRSGKTTFLAALWHILQASEINTTLRLHSLDGDRAHLNQLRSKWLGCRPLDRTTISSEKSVSFLLENHDSSQRTRLTIPDLSGETFRLQWKERRWSLEYRDLVRSAQGGLVVVHPSRLAEPLRIDAVNKLANELPPPATLLPQDTTQPEALVPWDADNAPVQVQIVELLQFICEHGDIPKPFPLALLVSAWDMLQEHEKTPEEWYKKRLPLLYQFISSNPEFFIYNFYGISAQGGDIENDQNRLRESETPSHRIRVVTRAQQNHDLTTPISWLLANSR